MEDVKSAITPSLPDPKGEELLRLEVSATKYASPDSLSDGDISRFIQIKGGGGRREQGWNLRGRRDAATGRA